MTKIYLTGSNYRIYKEIAEKNNSLNLKYHTYNKCQYYRNGMIELNLEEERKNKDFDFHYHQCKICFMIGSIEMHDELYGRNKK